MLLGVGLPQLSGGASYFVLIDLNMVYNRIVLKIHRIASNLFTYLSANEKKKECELGMQVERVYKIKKHVSFTSITLKKINNSLLPVYSQKKKKKNKPPGPPRDRLEFPYIYIRVKRSKGTKCRGGDGA